MRSCLISWLATLLLAPLGCDGDGNGEEPHQPEALPAPCGTLLPKGLVTKGEAGAAVCHEAGMAALRTEPMDLQLDGYLPIGPALTLRLDRPVGPYGVDVTLPISDSRIAALPGDLADPALIFKKNNRSKLVVLARFGRAPTHLGAISNTVVTWGEASALRFRIPGHEVGPLSAVGTLGDVATFQVAVPQTLSRAKKRRQFTYRAIAGVSMGGMGSSLNYFRHPDFFDAIAVLGADPGPDLTYSQGYIRDFFMAGFCSADRDGKDKIGKLCPATRQPLKGQGERVGDFEKMPVQRGEGIGLTLRRGVFLEANRDLVRALGNWAYANPKDPYLPPGVPRGSLAMKPADACLRANSTVLRGTDAAGASARPFYDGRYNPEGRFDVITFCDAEADGMPGVFDANKAQTNPVQILLAVDVNGNQRRDSGEPVVLQPGEPFRDVGVDGKASKDEPGYDAVTNPDPAGDDYHYLKNPGGTEGNWRWDKGEPFDDFGIDGVKGKGCDITGGQEGCFDFGEGNGKYDVNPGLAKWQAHDPRTLLEALPEAQLDRLDIYYDAGIRDFFNAHVATNSLLGALLARGRGLRSFDTFTALQGLGVDDDYKFDALRVDLSQLGRRAYVRYGNPGISDDQAAMNGDGRHVGTPQQLIQRASLAFHFLLSRWPDADRALADDTGGTGMMTGLSFKQRNGRETPFAMTLPPGYFDEANKDVRYPVAYFGHGLGQKPEDLATIGGVMRLLMADADDSKRLPKAILVFIDGRCRPGGDVTQAPLSMDGDRCEGGAFYTNHPEGLYQGETMIQELDAYLRTKFRLKEPAMLEVDDG